MSGAKSIMAAEPDVIVGVPICRRTSFVLDKFLANQREIQTAYLGCRLVLATDEPDFVEELKEQIRLHSVRGDVIAYETTKPDYARSRFWAVACGREALRQYALSSGGEYFLSLDSDMVYAPSVIGTMKDKMKCHDVAISGYSMKWGAWGFGAGCIMIGRETLRRITFRCYEFHNGQAIPEDTVLDMDMARCSARVSKGIFVSARHYTNSQHYKSIEPRPMGWFRAMTNSLLLRYLLIRMSILCKYNIPLKFHNMLYGGPGEEWHKG